MKMSGSYDRVMEDRKKLVEKIIENMKKGYILPKPDWNEGAFPGRIRNPVSGSEYQGANLLRLYMAGIERHCTDGRWMTYKQAQSMGWQVKKGEQGVRCEKYIFTKQIEEENPETGKMEKKTIRLSKPMVNTFVVFNASQIEGIPEQEVAALEPLEPDQILEMAEAFQRSSECPIRETNQGRAYYDPAKDEIVLPNRNAFVDTQAFLATQLHEMVHSTGHQCRLNRPFSYFFGSPEYAMEELRAELGAFFIQNDFQLDFDAQHFNSHTQYLESWIQALENDPNELFRAIADAQKAASYLEKGYEQQIDLDRELTAEPEAVFQLDGESYLYIQKSEMGIDYTFYDKDFVAQDGGQIDNPDLTMDGACKEVLDFHEMTVKQVDRVSVLEFERSLEQILENEPVKLTKQEEAAVRMAVKHELKKTGSGMEYLDHWIKKDTVKRQEIGIPMEEARTYSSMRNKYKQLLENPEQVLKVSVKCCSR